MLKPYNRAELTFEFGPEIGFDGRNSRTYVATDHQLNATIVLKQIAKTKLGDPALFFAEAQALYTSSHPNVVPVHYACSDNDHVYIAMPYMTAGSIKSLMNQRFLTVREIVKLGINMLSGLHHIHSKRLVHFDVKPDNILLTDRGEGVLADFGQAKQMNLAGTAEQDRFYAFMLPPEALGGGAFPLTFDIYQVGLTLYRMCCGNEAFEQQLDVFGGRAQLDRDAFRFAVRNGRFPNRQQFPAHIPQTLRTVIRTCLQTDPADRYQSALEVSNALAGLSGEQLDWQYLPVGDTRTWVKNEEGTNHTLTVSPDGASTMMKTVGQGNPRRVGPACRARVTDRDIGTILGGY